MEAPKAPEPAAKGGEPPAAEVIPPEEVAQNIAKLEERVADPRNVKRVTDPELARKYDVEVQLNGHTMHRERGTEKSCIFSPVKCDNVVGPKVNSEVDAALKTQPPEPKPVEEPASPGEPTPSTEPSASGKMSAKDIARESTLKEINRVEKEIEDVNRRYSKLSNEVSERGINVRRLNERAKATTGEAHAQACRNTATPRRNSMDSRMN